VESPSHEPPPSARPTRQPATGSFDEADQMLLASLRAGLNWKRASDLAGLSRQTIRNWIVMGRRSPRSRYRPIYMAIKKARSTAVLKAALAMQRHFDRDWRAAEAFLIRVAKEWRTPKEQGAPDLQVQQTISWTQVVEKAWEDRSARTAALRGAPSIQDLRGETPAQHGSLPAQPENVIRLGARTLDHTSSDPRRTRMNTGDSRHSAGSRREVSSRGDTSSPHDDPA
jgi:hypothetical protein